jgi:signal transduction histidine kinase
MAQRPEHLGRRGGFLWQGLLILLPVVVLAAIGLVSIQQDKALVQREAAERAQTLAQDLIETLWPPLVDEAGLTNEPSFEIDWTGQLISPPPRAALPIPQPFNLDELSPQQTEGWEAAQKASMEPGALTNALNAWREFVQASPPARWTATAQFRIAQLVAATGDAWSARGLFAAMATNYPDATGEAGLLLAPLARLKAVELGLRGSISTVDDVYDLCQSAVQSPTPLTPFLLDRVAELEAAAGGARSGEAWRKTWSYHEYLRQLYAAARPALTNRPPLPRLFWFSFGEFELLPGGELRECYWLATRLATNAVGAKFACRPALDERTPALLEREGSSVRVVMKDGIPRRTENSNFLSGRAGRSDLPDWVDPFLAALNQTQARLPRYFRLSVDIAGRPIIASNALSSAVLARDGTGGGQHWNGLESKSRSNRPPPPLLAVARKTDDGMEALRVGVHLVSPEMLYERQRSRSLLFGLLIAASAAAAVAGFVAARRAFLRSQQLSEMKSNFVSGVSHELRAPLASVRLMAENLERGKIADESKQREYFRFMIQECRRLGALVQNVLDYSRIEQGRKEYDFEPTDIGALVAQTVKLMQTAATEKNVALLIDAARRSDVPTPGAKAEAHGAKRAEPECGAPLLDAAAIQQALINLLDNAIKHSPTGATVLVGLTPPTPPATTGNSHAPRFTLYVQDSGPGIPREEHEKIFERFYRSGSELRRETQGVGIGLSIVKHITEAHGGRVVVESEVGKGSRFAMELPVDKAQSPKLKAQNKLQ